MILPFALLLVSMAAAPVLAPSWWARHYPKVALGLGMVTLAYYVFGLQAYDEVFRVGREYVSFVVLIGSLFVVSGGIHIVVKGEATPLANVGFLLAGAVLANVLGTTGAAMLLVRPWIRVNRHRIRPYHIVFFIFLVANIGGCLTPVGDPPLFLGFLQGIPFWWITVHAWPMWATAVGLLLAVFYGIDRYHFARSPKKAIEREVWRFDGWSNLVFLGVILGAVFIEDPLFVREAIMAAAAGASYFLTRRRFQQVHEQNEFEFHPVKEVAILFAGVFATMMPALGWLSANAGKVLGAHPGPGTYYWSTGGLSAVLDNAPTYLGFLSALHAEYSDGIAGVASHNVLELLAISVGAVFFGAATYIGNGPNFMIKAVAGRQGVPAPTFVGYITGYTLPVLAPVLVVVWLLFFR